MRMCVVYCRTAMSLRRWAVCGLLGCAQALVGAPISHADTVQRVIGQDEAAENYDARYHAARSLAREMTHDKAARLIRWVTEPADPLPPLAAAAIRHETVNQLIRTGQENDALTMALIQAFNDPQQTEVWRDYCLQHLGTLLPLVHGDRIVKIQDLLWQATHERVGALAGTALIALQRNLEHGITLTKLADRAAEVAADTRFGGGTRATALQILAEFHDSRALPPARDALENSRDVTLRLSALNVLGRMGDNDDLQVVERYTKSSIPVLKAAAKRAQDRLVNNL